MSVFVSLSPPPSLSPALYLPLSLSHLLIFLFNLLFSSISQSQYFLFPQSLMLSSFSSCLCLPSVIYVFLHLSPSCFPLQSSYFPPLFSMTIITSIANTLVQPTIQLAMTRQQQFIHEWMGIYCLEDQILLGVIMRERREGRGSEGREEER